MRKHTYRAVFNYTPPSGDVIQIIGSASRVVRMRQMRLYAATSINVIISRYLGANAVAGTELVTQPTKMPVDSNFPPATASVKGYSAAFTPGALVGIVDMILLNSGSMQSLQPTLDREVAALALRGADESLVFNLSGSFLTRFVLEWTEEEN